MKTAFHRIRKYGFCLSPENSNKNGTKQTDFCDQGFQNLKKEEMCKTLQGNFGQKFRALSKHTGQCKQTYV